jgi:hypothetical protein
LGLSATVARARAWPCAGSEALKLTKDAAEEAAARRLRTADKVLAFGGGFFDSVVHASQSVAATDALEMVSLDDLVPKDHLLRKIDGVIDFSFMDGLPDFVARITDGRRSDADVQGSGFGSAQHL